MTCNGSYTLWGHTNSKSTTNPLELRSHVFSPTLIQTKHVPWMGQVVGSILQHFCIEYTTHTHIDIGAASFCRGSVEEI